MKVNDIYKDTSLLHNLSVMQEKDTILEFERFVLDSKSSHPGFHVDQCVRNSRRRVKGRQEFVGDVNGLRPEKVVAGEGVQGQKSADVPNVGFENRNVADLRRKDGDKILNGTAPFN